MVRICETCGENHLGEYGSGRFCSSRCARSFSTKFNREEINDKVSKTLKSKYGFRPFPKISIESQLKRNNSIREFRKRNRLKLKELILSGLDYSEITRFKGRRKFSGKFKQFLFDTNLKDQQCEECGIKEIWNGKKLVLQLHHIDGDNTNNTLLNAQILCPNCHSQTSNFTTKKSS